MQHQIETERLILSPSSMNDLEKYLEMDLDPEVMKYLPGAWDGSEVHISFLRKVIQWEYEEGLGYWSIFLKDKPSQFIGRVLLTPYSTDAPEIEIGWRLMRSAWGNGYATEAAQALLEYAFNTIGLECIYAYIDSENDMSVKVAEKSGFKFFGDFIYDGVPCDAYRITRQKFLEFKNINPANN